MMRPDVDRIAQVVRGAFDASVVDDSTRAVLFHDLDCLHARLGALRAAFPSNALHAVAIKANPVVSILREVVDAGCGLEAASIEEVHLAVAAGCEPSSIVFDSPAKTVDELRTSLEWGVRINCDNRQELERLDALDPTKSDAVLGLRVNPAVGAGAIQATSVAGRRSRFGVPMEEALELYAEFDWLNAVHMHVGSQGCTLEQLLLASERLVEFRDRVGRARLRTIDIGGGLPVAYDSDATPPAFGEYTARLRERCPSLFEDDVQLVTEFGRAVHANCGFSLSRVEYVKDLGGVTSIVNHLGADLLLRPVYNPDDWRHEFLLLDPDGRPKTGPTSPVQVGGPLCFGGDIIGRDVELPPVQAGDWLVIRDVGAYTLSMWSRHCSRGNPGVVGVSGDSFRWLRKPESPADIVAFWS